MTSTKTDAPNAPSTGFGLPRLIPSLPMNMLNSINPFASPDQNKQTGETKEVSNTAEGGLGIPFLKRPLFGSIIGRPTSTPPTGEAETNGHAHKRNESTVMFAEPDDDSDNISREGSVVDERRRRRNKPKTSYSLCHPPPASSTTRSKLHRRPRSMLQLHKLSPNGRPVPAFEVIPSANFSVRLVKSITKTYKAKHGLCPSDLVILHAEKYYTKEHDDGQDIQDIVALICRGKSSDTRPKVIMSNGEEWEVSPHPAGGYEFHTTDDHGLDIVVRWWPKRARESKHGKDKRFNFSTIAAGTRKHPVIASLSGTSLEINDTYKVPDPAVSTPLSTPKNGDSFLGAAMEAEEGIGGDECATDDRLRNIITVTAIFVTFMEGTSPYFKLEEKDVLLGSPRKLDERSVSTPPASPQMRMLEKRGSIRSIGSGLLRRSSMLSASNRDSTLSVDSLTSAETNPHAPNTVKHGRTRSDSASTVLVHRATSNRRKAKQQATWRPDLLSVKNTVPETSREDLTRMSTDRKTKTRSSLNKSAHKDTTTTDDDEDDEIGPDEPVKRESSTTTATTASVDASRPQPADFKRSGTTKKASRWRRMLSCMR